MFDKCFSFCKKLNVYILFTATLPVSDHFNSSIILLRQIQISVIQCNYIPMFLFVCISFE
jgi:hypothetical protein